MNRSDAGSWLAVCAAGLALAAVFGPGGLTLVAAPAAVGLGFVRLAADDYDAAATLFGRAVEANDEYLPAWQGLMDARLGPGPRLDKPDAAIM